MEVDRTTVGAYVRCCDDARRELREETGVEATVGDVADGARSGEEPR